MYNEFYGFSEKPFEITPDPKFLYLSRTHREALDGTIKSIKNRSPFTSITGEVGTGKTILIYSILIRLGEKVKTAFIFHPSVTFTELIRIILQDLDQEVIGESKEVPLRQLNEYLLKTCHR
jgi:type II secretory pathway predicted ATPase ExeA